MCPNLLGVDPVSLAGPVDALEVLSTGLRYGQRPAPTRARKHGATAADPPRSPRRAAVVSRAAVMSHVRHAPDISRTYLAMASRRGHRSTSEKKEYTVRSSSAALVLARVVLWAVGVRTMAAELECAGAEQDASS